MDLLTVARCDAPALPESLAASQVASLAQSLVNLNNSRLRWNTIVTWTRHRGNGNHQEEMPVSAKGTAATSTTANSRLLSEGPKSRRRIRLEPLCPHPTNDPREAAMELASIRIPNTPGATLIIGQARGGERIDDIYRALETIDAHFAFGLAYSETSGKCLIRVAGTDERLTDLARTHARVLGAGDVFVLLHESVAAPGEVLSAVKALPEVCTIFCATQNPVEVALGVSAQGNGIIGVIDGDGPKDVESTEESAWRRDYLLHVAGFRR